MLCLSSCDLWPVSVPRAGVSLPCGETHIGFSLLYTIQCKDCYSNCIPSSYNTGLSLSRLLQIFLLC